jgi:BASS family bile acid:Na+ symporter
MLHRWLLLWLCLLSTVAYYWPSALGVDPFQASRDWLSQIIVVTMFALGWLLPADEVREVFRRWPLVVGGTAVQYLSMPLLAWLIASTFPLTNEFQLGIILVGCVPGAMASNVLTLVAGGNASYSLSLTTMSTCLSPILVPLGLRLTMRHQLAQPLTHLVLELTWMVLLPVVVGHVLGRNGGKSKRRWDPWFQQLAALAILWIIAVVVGANRQRMDQLTMPLLLAVITLNLSGYLAGQLGAGVLQLDDPKRRALILEIGMQNAGLGTALAGKLFPSQPDAMIPSALYTFGCMLTGTVLAWHWRQRRREGAAELEP